MILNEKIGMYTEDEILEHLTEGEGRGFLGRSMYDAIFDKIHALKTENEQLKQENSRLKDKIDRINKLLNEPIFEYDNIPCNIENEIIQLKDILKEN